MRIKIVNTFHNTERIMPLKSVYNRCGESEILFHLEYENYTAPSSRYGGSNERTIQPATKNYEAR
jgi:hypothetical protein